MGRVQAGTHPHHGLDRSTRRNPSNETDLDTLQLIGYDPARFSNSATDSCRFGAV